MAKRPTRKLRTVSQLPTRTPTGPTELVVKSFGSFEIRADENMYCKKCGQMANAPAMHHCPPNVSSVSINLQGVTSAASALSAALARSREQRLTVEQVSAERSGMEGQWNDLLELLGQRTVCSACGNSGMVSNVGPRGRDYGRPCTSTGCAAGTLMMVLGYRRRQFYREHNPEEIARSARQWR